MVFGFERPLSPQDIYEQLTGGAGPRSLFDLQRATRTAWVLEEERAERIHSLVEIARDGWQGDAVQGALAAGVFVTAVARSNAERLAQAEDLLDRQGGSFERAANSVQPVPPEPPDNPLDDLIPWETDHDKQVRAYQTAAQHNIEVFRGYDNASHHNETNMPAHYPPFQDLGGDGSTPPEDTISSDSFDSDGPGPRDSGDPGPGPTPDPGPTPGPGPRDSGDPSPGPGPAPGPHPYPPGATPHPPGSATQTSPNDHRPTPLPPAQGPYPLAAPPQPAPLPGPGGYLAGFGPGTAASPGPATRGHGPTQEPVTRGPGATSGPGGNPRAAEQAAARGAQARPGGANLLGGAPPTPARNKDDEDTEHDRRYLVESDPEDTFGSDVLTAPQVIGDDAYED